MHTITHTKITKPHKTHTITQTQSLDVALSHLSLSSLSHQQTLIAHILSPVFFYFDSSNIFLQRWSRYREDCSVIQEQYLLGVWRCQANRGLWLNAWHGINAPCHEGRSSYQDHSHQESHVLRYKFMQCSSICIALHHIFYEYIHSPNILSAMRPLSHLLLLMITLFKLCSFSVTIHQKQNQSALSLSCSWILNAGYNSSSTCGYRDVLVNMCLENDITTREFLNVCPVCVCAVLQYMCHVYVYILISLDLTHFLSLRPRLEQACMRIAAHFERVCGTKESRWPQTLCCLPKYALRIVCDSVYGPTRSRARALSLSRTHTHTQVGSWWHERDMSVTKIQSYPISFLTHAQRAPAPENLSQWPLETVTRRPNVTERRGKCTNRIFFHQEQNGMK